MIILLFAFFLLGVILIFIYDYLDLSTKKLVFILFGILLIFFAGFRDGSVVKDYENYVRYFNESNDLIEPSFTFISFLIKKVFNGNEILLFLVYGFLGVALKFRAILELSSFLFISVLIYISYFYILQELTQMRVGVASGFLLLCVKPIYERDWKRFLLFATLGFVFHYSALLIFLLWFLSKEKSRILLLCVIPFCYLIYFLKLNLVAFLPIPGIQEKLEIYQKLQESGDEVWNSINVFNLLFLSRIAIFYFLFWKYDLILSRNKYLPILMKIYAISLISFLVFANVPVIAFRINELFGIVEIILFPFILYAIKPDYLSKGITLIISIFLFYISIFYNGLIIF